MNKERLMTVLQRPHLSEKSSVVMEGGYYAFKVDKSASKQEIAKAVELMFEVNVDQVRTLNVKGHKKHFRNVPGTVKAWKKAYVKLQEGQAIDFGRGSN